jgi:signal recognition particle receptor subunit beta
VQLNPAHRELTVKVVYYGPGLSGKTTNLQHIHSRANPDSRSSLVQVETRDDRTLFFDMLPVVFESQSGFRVKVKLFTVPGQVLHNATRRVVLQNADAVAFIADSRRSAVKENNAYWRDLQENMKDVGLNQTTVPVVIQFNKMDLPDARSPEEIEQSRAKGNEVIVGAVAVRGEGVLETLHAVLQQAYRRLDELNGLARTVGLTEQEFLRQVFSQLDCVGTALAGRYQAGKVAQGRA